jgi:hypothetical protein
MSTPIRNCEFDHVTKTRMIGSKMLQVKIWRNHFISILELTSWHASTLKNWYVYANQKL